MPVENNLVEVPLLRGWGGEPALAPELCHIYLDITAHV